LNKGKQMTRKKTVEFEEGWADELGLTQEELDAVVRGITELVTTGEICEDAILLEDLPEDEQYEILEQINRKNTRH
jgi:hypothetical protein